MENKYRDLQIAEDMRQQRIEWTVERIAWFFLYILLAGIVLGLLGQGPIASAKLRGAEGATLMEYKRFLTVKSSANFKVVLPPSSGNVRVVLDHDYLAKLQLRNVVPTPEKMVAEGDGLAFVFNADAQEPVQVHFYYEAQQAGLLEGWVSVAGNPRQRFSQFAYP